MGKNFSLKLSIKDHVPTVYVEGLFCVLSDQTKNILRLVRFIKEELFILSDDMVFNKAALLEMLLDDAIEHFWSRLIVPSRTILIKYNCNRSILTYL